MIVDVKVTEAIGGGAAATFTCECGETFRLQLADEHLQAIAMVVLTQKMMRALQLQLVAAMHDTRDELQIASTLCIDFTVWLLTHATKHIEAARRDASKERDLVH